MPRNFKLALYALAALLLAWPVHAQDTRAQMQTYNDTYFYACGTNCITGPQVNTQFGNLINGMGVLNDTNVWTGTNTFNGTTTFNGTVNLGSLSLPLSAITGFGTGVEAALATNIQSSGSVVLQNGTIANGHCLSWSALGLVDSGGACVSGLIIGTTTITGGSNGSIETNNSGVLGETATTGSGNVVLATSPTLVTPALGTPASGLLTNTTGFPLANLAGAGSGVLAAAANATNGTGGLLVSPAPATQSTFAPPWTGGQTVTQQARGQNVAYATDFGASGLSSSANGTMTGGTASITLTGSGSTSFVNGQGIKINQAGPTPGGFGSISCTATAYGADNGVVETYYVEALDPFGGASVAATCNTSHGATTLNAQNYISVAVTNFYSASLTGYIGTGAGGSGSHSNTLTVATVSAGLMGEGQTIAWSTTGAANGTWTTSSSTIPVSSCPTNVDDYQTVTDMNNPVGQQVLGLVKTCTGTTLTLQGKPLYANSGATGDTLVFSAKARIIGYGSGSNGGTTGTYILDRAFSLGTSGSPITLTAASGYAIIKSGGQYTGQCPGGTSECLLGFADQGTYYDVGLLSHDAGGGGPFTPTYLPTTHLTTVQPDWCVNSVLSGGGTASLTLAATCPNSVTSKTVRHDDTAALNACLASANPQNRCVLPDGTYNISSALLLAQSNIYFEGNGWGSSINPYGTQDALALSGTKASQQTSVEVHHMLISGQSTNALGHTIEGVYQTRFGPIDDVRMSGMFDGVECFDCNLDGGVRYSPIVNMVNQFGNCYYSVSDGDLGSTTVYFKNSCSVTGGANNYNSNAHGLYIDGAIGGGHIQDMIIASIDGEGWRISNDIGATSGPIEIQSTNFDPEFSIGAGIHVTGGAANIIFSGENNIGDQGWENFVSCAAGAGMLFDNGTSYIAVLAGNIRGGSSAGIYSDAQFATIRPMSVQNNSRPGSGGTSGGCAGIELGPHSVGNIVAGVNIGGSAAYQSYPVKIDAGAALYNVYGNTFNSTGQVASQNYVLNGAAGAGIVLCNSGASPPDCSLAAALAFPQGGNTGVVSGAIPYGSNTTTLSMSGLLTQYALMTGGGAGAAPATLGSLGTTTTVLHGNASGVPSFGAVALATDVSGNLPVANLNGGSGASSSTYWRGDGTWSSAAGGTPSYPVTVAGTVTSGGIPYFNSTTQSSSSALLTQYALVVGGGAGGAPSTLGSLGTTTTVLHGNASGTPTFGAVSLTADVSGNLPVGNLNSGTSASSSTYWRGDGTWATPPGSGGLTVGSTTITSGTSGYAEYNNAGVLGEKAITANGTVGFPAMRRITSGTTDTATTADSTIVIALGSPANFAETLPACVSGIRGQKITVKDALGQAGGNAITVKATTSTVDTIAGATGLIMSSNYQSITFQCDDLATNGNWMAE